MEPEKIAALRKAIDRVDRKEQIVISPTRVESFYIPTKVESTLRSLRAEVVKESLLEYDEITIDRLAQMKRIMHSNYKDVKALIERHGDGVLKISTRHSIPTAPVKLKEFEPFFTNADKEGGYQLKPARGAEPKIKKLISELPPANRYAVDLVVGIEERDDIPEYRSLMDSWGVSSNEDNSEYRMIRALLAEALALIRLIHLDKKMRGGLAPNVRENVNQLMTRNVARWLLDIPEGVSRGRDPSRLTEGKRITGPASYGRIIKEGGFPALSEDNSVIPASAQRAFDVGDYHGSARIIAIKTVGTAIESISALWKFVQDNPKHEGPISLKKLAEYSPKHKKKIQQKRPSEAMKELFMGLWVMDKMQVYHNVGMVQKKNPDTGKIEKFRKGDFVRIINLKSVYTKKEELDIGAIGNVEDKLIEVPYMVDVSFTEEYLSSLGRYSIAMIMNRISEFSSDEYKIMALRLIEEFTHQQKDTANNKPIEIRVKDLYDLMPPADKNNAARRRDYMTNFFNEAKKLGRITNWKSSITNRTRVAYSGLDNNKKNQYEKIAVFPGEEYIQNYVTPEMRDLYRQRTKLEQSNRQQNLKRLFDIEDESGKRYGDFLKFVDDINEEMDSLEYKTTVSSQQLLNMYSGKTIITDEVNAAVTSLLEPIDMSE